MPAGVAVGPDGLIGTVTGAVAMFTTNRVSAEYTLTSPIELMAATDTVYSALGTRSHIVTLVAAVFTEVWALVPSLSLYVTV